MRGYLEMLTLLPQTVDGPDDPEVFAIPAVPVVPVTPEAAFA